MNRTKSILVAAGVVLALVLTFGCAGGKSTIDGFGDFSVGDKMLMKCQQEFKSHYCGQAEGISTKAGSAGDIAQGRATANLILQMKQDVIREVRGGSSVDQNDADVSAALSAWGQSSAVSVNNVEVRASETQYNKEEGKYRVYRIVSVPKGEALKALQSSVSSDQALQSTATAAAILSIIDNSIGKLKE
ncbi:MAG: hypothetical protein FWC15_03255 [Fibromonadales bacterium]|nr:hypothetical protein [Fibromonadales bacterium]